MLFQYNSRFVCVIFYVTLQQCPNFFSNSCPKCDKNLNVRKLIIRDRTGVRTFLPPQGFRLWPEEAIIEGCTYIYRMYLQSEYTVCIPEKISVCSNRGRMESLGNDDVSLQTVRKYLVNLVARVLSLLRESALVMAGHVSKHANPSRTEGGS